MNKAIISLVFLVFTSQVKAQIPVDIMTGHEATEFSFFWFEDVDKKNKVELFNFTFYSVNYRDQALNTHEIYQTVTYKIDKNWGISGVGRFAFNEFIPQIAFSYQLFTDDFFFALYPYTQYSGLQKKWSYGGFGFLLWTPRINESWKLFHMTLFETNINRDSHQFSYQQFRLGLEYKNGVQFGFGATTEQIGKDFQTMENIGLFVRKEL